MKDLHYILHPIKLETMTRIRSGLPRMRVILCIMVKSLGHYLLVRTSENLAAGPLWQFPTLISYLHLKHLQPLLSEEALSSVGINSKVSRTPMWTELSRIASFFSSSWDDCSRLLGCGGSCWIPKWLNSCWWMFSSNLPKEVGQQNEFQVGHIGSSSASGSFEFSLFHLEGKLTKQIIVDFFLLI